MRREAAQGEAVELETMKPPGTKRSSLKYDDVLSTLAFSVDLHAGHIRNPCGKRLELSAEN